VSADRTYGQYCALAKALDVVGDRWALLIIRELLLRGACRYTDLQTGLPGIATNLLAARLRRLEADGVVRREAAQPPVAITLFHLTERGKELEPVLLLLGAWGAPLMAEPAAGDAFCTHWLSFPVRQFLHDRNPDGPPVTILLAGGGDARNVLTIEAGGGKIHTRIGGAESPDLVLTGAAQLLVGVLAGKLRLSEAKAAGLVVEGDPAALERLLPKG
jgi:DNA-binding HxlR family transcriptional regulator